VEQGRGSLENLELNIMIVSTDKFWKNKRILVTGGAGFVGSWLSYELANRDASVVILDTKPAMRFLGEPSDSILRKTLFVRGDVRDASLLHTLFMRHGFDVVFHLAAHVLVEDVLTRPGEALDTNIMGTVRVLEESRKHRGVSVIVASSDKAYGIHENLPYKEHFPLFGENHPYDCSKSCADQIARMYARVYKLPVVVTRCGNIYGGGDMNFSRLIPGTIRALLHEKPVELRSDGLHRRDYVYIQDVVSAYLSAAEHLTYGKVSGEAFNFGYNKPLQVFEVVDLISKLTGKTHLKPVVVNNARNEIFHQYLDASKSGNVLGWRPQYGIEKGLRETIDWYIPYFQKHDLFGTGLS
jgi:CDP-glucose 4,6-dehydratase